MRTTLTSCVCAALLLGCVVADAGGGTATGTTTPAPVTDGVSETGATTESAASSTGELPTTTTSSSSSTTDDASDFVVTVDVPGDIVACDTFTQDCPEGMKCAPYAEGGGLTVTATKCVPIMGDQLPGEPCIAESFGVTGLDDCVEGALCWDVDAMNMGTCVAQCTGSLERPTCPEIKTGCAVVGDDGVLSICLPYCEPLIQDCPGDDLCLPVTDVYLCVLDDSGDAGAAFDPCEYVNACDKGLVCLPPTAADECDAMAVGCCLPMCSIAEGAAACPGADQQCFPMYEPQFPGFEDVGYCSLMPL